MRSFVLHLLSFLITHSPFHPFLLSVSLFPPSCRSSEPILQHFFSPFSPFRQTQRDKRRIPASNTLRKTGKQDRRRSRREDWRMNGFYWIQSRSLSINSKKERSSVSLSFERSFLLDGSSRRSMSGNEVIC